MLVGKRKLERECMSVCVNLSCNGLKDFGVCVFLGVLSRLFVGRFVREQFEQ